ncbi:MAG: hypothetical protein KBD01_11075 [Acidobacteria bacterium]|nr:hypothetical protein [Acidobacteriota bacterium]
MPVGGALRAESQILVGDYSPEVSLAALESILRAHSVFAGRKVVLWFSSSLFNFSQAQKDRMEASVRRIVDLTQQGGYSVWTVDVAGLSGGGDSPLMSSLAGDTGGQSVRRANDLAPAFRGASEMLSCYYLFSLPVEVTGGSARRMLTVKLDTDRYKDYWGFRVSAPSAVQVTDQATRNRDQRIAALLSPDDFSRPAVAATIDFPADTDKGPVLPVRFRVPLAALDWIPLADGNVQSRLLVDGVVQRDTEAGTEPVCEVGAEKLGALSLRLPKEPKDPLVGFTVEVPCAYKKDGLYVARGVFTDMEAEQSGAGRSTVQLKRGGSAEWAAMALRVEANSGIDLLWRPGASAARRDKERSGFRVVSDDKPADPGEQVALSYVLCGPERSDAKQKVQHMLVARGADGTGRVLQMFGPEDVVLTEKEGAGQFCSQARVKVPEYSLEYGRYAFAVVKAGASVDAALVRVTAPATAPPKDDGVLAVTNFAIGKL